MNLLNIVNDALYCPIHKVKLIDGKCPICHSDKPINSKTNSKFKIIN